MSRASASDKRYLERKDGKFRVVVSVPRSLHAEMGTKLKQALHTDSLASANALKWQVVAEMKARINAALKRGGKDPLAREALAIAALRARAQTVEDHENLEAAVSIRLDQIAGPVLDVRHLPNGEVVEERDPERDRQAHAFAEMASGKATPLAAHHEEYLTKVHVKSRTKADDVRALGYLVEWCDRNRVAPTLQAITKKVAVRFADTLGTVTTGQSPTTLKKYVGRLRVYWTWLEKHFHVETNVWVGVSIQAPSAKHGEEEREFSRDEMLKLLEGPATQHMHDLMRIGALTGARLDAIVDLSVADCEDGVFLFKPQKREKKARAVPIHSALKEIVERRTKDKKPDDPFFPEWPAALANGQRERSFKASNAFTSYRREVGVEEQIPGKRRSLVNFHSFRRWFVTQAERADQAEHIIAVVVGHKRTGLTLGRYSGGPLRRQAQRCVEAVRLPERPKPRKQRIEDGAIMSADLMSGDGAALD